MERRAVITSIAPQIVRTVRGNDAGGPAYQAECIQCWAKAGFDVISLNSADEAAAVAAAYPQATVVVAERDARAQCGRPLVYINDLITGLNARGYRVGGIINADIFTMRDRAYFDRLIALCDRGAVYGMRIDVSDLAADAQAELYDAGYDYFFFDVAMAQAVPRADYVLGMPWWDLWFPVALTWAGLRLHRIFSPTGFHLKHPEATGGILNFAWRHYYKMTVAQMTAQLRPAADPAFTESFRQLPAFEQSDWEVEAVALGQMVQTYLNTVATPQNL
jgi:hypothetical protein